MRIRQTQAQRIAAVSVALLLTASANLGAESPGATATSSPSGVRQASSTLDNPFSLHNIAQWLLDHGPSILGVLLAVGAMLWLARVLEKRMIRFLAARGESGTFSERQNRARTLVSVAHNTLRVVLLAGGLLMVLAQVGIDIVPLMGGAAVVGLAVAFGAQHLVRDYFAGFVMLLENQYAVDDVVRIGDVAGQVERITLRMTVLRSLDGTVSFIPNGEIKTVRNLTHEWSRALFDIPVAYTTDVDRVMAALKELGEELRTDPAYRPMILGPLEMLGVDSFAESAVMIRFFIKTRPRMQWVVRRELLRRIKSRFDELGIEIPLPQRVVHHRDRSEARRDLQPTDRADSAP